MSAPQLAGVGFFAHTGWAAAVALAGPLDAPRVAARRRLELWDNRQMLLGLTWRGSGPTPRLLPWSR